MKIEIRYLSKSGNTEKIAKIIAKEINIEAHTIEKKLPDNIDILFLGGALYAFDIDPELKKFIQNIDSRIENVVVFGTSSLSKSVCNNIKKHLKKKNIKVLDEYFYCKGEMKFLNKNRPNEEDMKSARKFANEIINKLK